MLLNPASVMLNLGLLRSACMVEAIDISLSGYRKDYTVFHVVRRVPASEADTDSYACR